jgi:hypothetical protein
MTWVILTAVAFAASGDNVQFNKDCPQYVARYRALLQDRAERDVEAAPASPGASPLLLRVGQSRERAQSAFEEVKARVERSCRAANRSQYECVVQAERYEDLRACQLDALPILDAAQQQAPPPPPSPPTADQRARATESFAREWVRSGTADVEALGTGSGSTAATPEPSDGGAAASGE